MADEYHEQSYTHPELRERLKQQIQNSDKGGEPGQWSARKAQLLAQEYEKQGGGYLGGKDKKQRGLTEWTQEQWQTREGKAQARDPEAGETRRYLPKEAWQKMSRQQARDTDQKKRDSSRQGRQFVDNTGPAKQARERSLAPPLADYDELSVEEVERKVKGLSKEEVERVREYENRHKGRKTLISALQRRLSR